MKAIECMKEHESMPPQEPKEYDVIIIGAGIAGLFSALKIADFARVCLLTKNGLQSSNTWLAQGGIAAALGEDDSPEQHAEDTLQAGAELCRQEAVDVLTNEGPARIQELLAMGVPFDRRAGKLDLGQEGAHGKRRIVHAGGDSTGRLLSETLMGHTLTRDTITVRENTYAVELFIQDNQVFGVKLLNGEHIFCRALILATGGCSAVYARTTNNPVLTGDGIAMAYRAGAEIIDMEFVQFHPTVFHGENNVEPFLVSEAVRGEGAVLRDKFGRCFMGNYCESAELGPRDIVSRAIAKQMELTGSPCVYLDITRRGKAFIQERFPTIYQMALKHGYDLARQWLPVSPAAHYTMGGIRVGLSGETRIKGLYACGEAACSGVHGANRLASNSLLEGLVFAVRTARHIQDSLSGLRRLTGQEQPERSGKHKKSPCGPTHEPCAALKEKLGKLILHQAGITRNAAKLEEAKKFIQQEAPPDPWIPRERAAWELKNLFLVARFIVEGALERTESRGSHYREDYPYLDPSWNRSIYF